jgi:osmotically-inducible protein OsmY
MIRTSWMLGFVLIVFISGCKGSDPDRLRAVARKTGDKIKTLLPTEEKVEATLDSLLAADIAWRVRCRINDDRYLRPSQLNVEHLGEGKIRLFGTVTEEVFRERAVELASSTTGVTEVIDEIEVTGP